MPSRHAVRLATVTLLSGLLGGVASAQTPPPSAGKTVNTTASAAAPDSLALFFETGSVAIRPQDVAVLDRASRIYTDGKPTVMILTATTDGVGTPIRNLRLSQQRALAVVNQLVARGIPAERFQILAKGVTDPSVPDPAGTPEPKDRRVDIAWR